MQFSADVLEASIRKNVPRFSVASQLLRVGADREELREALLAFVDVLPALRSNKDVARYFVDYVGPHYDFLPRHMQLGVRAAGHPYTASLMGRVIRYTIMQHLAPHFIVESTEDFPNYPIVIDVLGEKVLSYAEADAYRMRYHALLTDPQRKPGERLHVAVKFSSLYPHFSPENWEESKRHVTAHFSKLLRLAKVTDTHITVDAEDHYVCRLTEEIFLDVVMQAEFAGYPHVGIALQAYRKDARASAFDIVSAAKGRSAPICVRLIKGAYWDTEAMVASQNGWEFPLFENKDETDKSFVEIAGYLLLNHGRITLLCGTHNPESIAEVITRAQEANIPTPEFQVLYGLGEPVRKALVAEGLHVRVYVPLGDLEVGMAYFARRLLENTANNGFMAKLL